MDTARLELRKAGADEALLQVSAEVRRLQRASRLEQGRVRRVLDRVSEVAFILFVWSCPDATMALAYVADQEGRRQLPFPTLTREELEGRYLKTPVEVLGDIWRGVEGCRPGCLAEAKRYHRDFGLSAWVQDQNEKKGRSAHAPNHHTPVAGDGSCWGAFRPIFISAPGCDVGFDKVGMALAASVGFAVRVLWGAGTHVWGGKAGEGAGLGS